MAENRKDYYKILGITEEEKKLPWDEFLKAEKQHYKKLALQFHPDKWTNKSEKEQKEAEEKFKEIVEAHEVLSNKEKKDAYDNPAMGGFEGFDPSNFGGFNPFGGFDPFSFFNKSRSRTKNERQVQKGGNVRISISVTLEEVFNGANKTFKYKRQEPCSHCHGSGVGANGRIETCPICGGTGTEFKVNGAVQMMSTCRHCGGTGKVIKNPCTHCQGSGLEPKSHEVSIDIPKGIINDSDIIVCGEGNLPPTKDGIPGDLIVHVNVAEHEKFVRRNNDLLLN